MAKLYDKDGNEVEAFTQEELKAKQDEAIETYLKENPDKGGDLTKLQTELADAKKKLEDFEKAGNGNDAQKQRLIQEKKDAENTLATTVAKLQKDMDDFKGGILNGAKETALKNLTKGDKELQAKIELRAANLTGYPDTAEGVAQKLADAFVLATGTKPAHGFMDSVTSSGGKGTGNLEKGGAGVETDGSKQIRTGLGITDQTEAKYGKIADEILANK